MFEYTSNPFLVSPSPWAPVTVGAGAWVDSAYVDLLNPTPGTGIIVMGAVVAVRPTIIDVSEAFEVDLATDAGIFGTVCGHVASAANYGPGKTFRPLGIPYSIDAGLRVKAKLRKSYYSAGNEGTWGIGLGYYALPIVGNIQTTTQKQKVLPASDWGIGYNFGSTPLWTWSPWQTMTSGLPNAIYLTTFEYKGDSTVLFEAELGYGVGPTPITRIRNRISGGTSGKGGSPDIDFMPPVGPIPAGNAISVRFRQDLFSAPGFGGTIWAKIAYLESPL